MTYKPRKIEDRCAKGDDIFKKKDLENGRFQLISDPDQVNIEGTNVNRELMQPWEDIHAAVSGSDEIQLRMLWNGRVVRFTNRGLYSSNEEYNQNDCVISAEGNGFYAGRDGLIGVTPPSEANGCSDDWRPFEWQVTENG